jgi:hypothetical protein
MVRPGWFATLGVCCLAAWGGRAAAQSSLAIGAGWNYLARPPLGNSYHRGFNLLAAVGGRPGERIFLRGDLVIMQYDRLFPFNGPCPPGGCTTPPTPVSVRSNTFGLLANVVVHLDPRGYTYLVGGIGGYGVHVLQTNLRAGVAAGVGINVPLGNQLRGFVEVRLHELVESSLGPTWYLPITFGLRY